jgi:hypothetical protein
MTATVMSALAVIDNHDDRKIMAQLAKGLTVAAISDATGFTVDHVLSVVNRVSRNQSTAREAVRYYDTQMATPAGRKEVEQAAAAAKAPARPARVSKAKSDQIDAEIAAAAAKARAEQEIEAAAGEQIDESSVDEDPPAEDGPETVDNPVDSPPAETESETQPEQDEPADIPPDTTPDLGDVEALLTEAETYGTQEHVQAAHAIRRHVASLRNAMADIHEQRAIREGIAELSRQISDLQQRREDEMNRLKQLTGRPSVRVTASDLLTKAERAQCRQWAHDNDEPAPRTGPIPIATIEKWREATDAA